MFHMACYLKEQHGTTSLHTPFLHKIISVYLYIYAFLCNISNCFDNLKHFSASCPNTMQNSLVANGYAKDFHLSSDINAASRGQLQIFSEHIQRYLSLCYPSLSFSAAHVICRQLGFTTVLYIYPIPKNEQLNPILQFSIDCHGYEPVFEECWIVNSSQENCSQFVGIQCTACTYELKEPKGAFSSPGFPFRYFPSVECEWTIFVPRYYELVLNFGTFDLPYSKVNHSCVNGYLEIGYILNKGRHKLARFCGHYVMKPFVSESSVTWIRFYSGWPLRKRYPTGFNVTFERRKIDYGTATFAQILLAVGFGGVLIVMMIACVCCYWKRTCKAKKMKETANRKQTMVKLIEQLAQDTSY